MLCRAGRRRQQALDRLKADFSAWAKVVENGPPRVRPIVQRALAHWQKDADLASVRDPRALERLPPAERDDWKKLRADVRHLLQQVGKEK